MSFTVRNVNLLTVLPNDVSKFFYDVIQFSLHLQQNSANLTENEKPQRITRTPFFYLKRDQLKLMAVLKNYYGNKFSIFCSLCSKTPFCTDNPIKKVNGKNFNFEFIEKWGFRYPILLANKVCSRCTKLTKTRMT